MKNKKERLKYRMYGLVPYQLTGIQKGIQYGHAVVEYASKFYSSIAYANWAKHDKTFIILDGGTSNSGKESFYGIDKHLGTMEAHLAAIRKMGFKVAEFREPDLNYMLSAFVFLVDERVWDKDKYPDPLDVYANGWVPPSWISSVGGKNNADLRMYLKNLKLASN